MGGDAEHSRFISASASEERSGIEDFARFCLFVRAAASLLYCCCCCCGAHVGRVGLLIVCKAVIILSDPSCVRSGAGMAAVSVNGRIGGPSASSLNAVYEAINARRFTELADLLDNLELETACSEDGIPHDWPYTIHLLAHVVVEDLSSARFLWKRTPPVVKQNNAELAAAWKIVQHFWTHDHAGVHEALCSYNWSPDVQLVISAVAEDHSKRTLKLLNTAYSTINVADAAAFLGMTENEVVNYTVGQHGWTFDPLAKMLTVAPSIPAVEQKTDASQLQSLTEYVFHLEH